MAVLNLDGASVLSYSVDKRYLGEAYNIGCTENLTVRNIITGGSNYQGVQKVMSQFETILNTDQHVEDIIINGHNFGEGRLKSVDFSSNNPVRVGEYTAEFEIFTSGNLTNLVGRPPSAFGGASDGLASIFEHDRHLASVNMHLVESITEDTSASINEENKCSIVNNVSVKFFASGKNSNPIREAKILARSLMHYQLRWYPTMGKYYQNEAEGGPAEWSEEYDLINLNFSFSKTVNLARGESDEGVLDNWKQGAPASLDGAGGGGLLSYFTDDVETQVFHIYIAPYNNYTTRTLSYNDNGTINVTENGEIQFRGTELTHRFPDARGINTVAEHAIRSEIGPPLENFPNNAHLNDSRFTEFPEELCYEELPNFPSYSPVDYAKLPRSWRRCFSSYDQLFQRADGTRHAHLDKFSNLGESTAASGLTYLQCQPITIGKTINSGSSTASYSITYTDDPKMGDNSVHEYTISVNDSESQVVTVSENGMIRPYNRKAINFEKTTFKNDKNHVGELSEALNSAGNRMKSAYDQYAHWDDTVSPRRKLTETNRSFSFPRYGKEMTYSVTSNDDPANTDIYGLRRLEISISDNAPVNIHNTYKIPGHGELLHYGMFQQTQVGTRSVTLTAIVERGTPFTHQDSIITPPALGVPLAYMRQVILEQARTIITDMNSLLIQDIWITNLSYGFNSADRQLTVTAEITFIAARSVADLTPRT